MEMLLRQVLEGRKGRTLMTVASASMRPRLEEGDRILVQNVTPRVLRPGDVVVFASEKAGVVVHRLVWRKPLFGLPKRIYTKGDALDRLDASIPANRILGRVTGVVRGGSQSNPTVLADRIRCLVLAARCGFKRWLRRGGGPLPGRTPSRLDREERR